MSGSLGKLTVNLALDYAAFTSGLTKSEQAAQNFSRKLARNIDDAVKSTTLAFGALSVAGGAALTFIDNQAEKIGSFKSLGEQIGDTSNAVAGLRTVSATSGVAMDSIAAASVKLTTNLAKTDDEGTAAGRAIKALGLNLVDFKALSPVAQLEATATALAKFQDGAGKTAVAVAAFGKEGAALLPFLNDLADAGGRNERLTRDQIEAADALTKQFARMHVETDLLIQSFASRLIPTVADLLQQFTDGKKIAGGFLDALLNFGTINPFKSVADNIATVRSEIDALKKGGLNLFNPTLAADASTQIDKLTKKLQFLELQQRQAANALISPSNNDARDFLAQQKPRLDFTNIAKPGGDSISAAQRFLESLQRQLDKTDELTTAESALREIQSGRLGAVTPAIQQQILAVAGEIDAYKELKDWISNAQKASDDWARAQDKAAQESQRVTDSMFDQAQAIIKGNDDLRDQIAIITGGEAARKQLEQSHLALAIAQKQDALAAAQLDPALQGVAAALQQQINALQTRQALVADKTFAEAMAEDAKQVQQLRDVISDSFTTAFDSLIDGSKSAKDAFRSLATDIDKQLTHLALQDVFDGLFGGKSGGGMNFGKAFNGLLGGLFGGGGSKAAGAVGATTADTALLALGATSTTVVTPALATLAGAAALASGALSALSIGSGAGAISDFAGTLFSGVGGLAGGTDFWKGGPTWVGENGPELVNLPRGAKVTPAAESKRMAGGHTFNVSVNVLPGASTRSADQAAGEMVRQLQRAAARIG